MRRRRFHGGIPPQLCQFVGTAPSGPRWLHEIKLDGFRMSARIERGRVQLLTRTGLDWSDKYPSIVEALAKGRAKTAYLDGEMCGIGHDGLPSFSQTQAASDGSRGVQPVCFAFDLLHLDGRVTAAACRHSTAGEVRPKKAAEWPKEAGRPRAVSVCVIFLGPSRAHSRPKRICAIKKTAASKCRTPTSSFSMTPMLFP